MNMEDLRQEWKGQTSKEDLILTLYRDSKQQKVNNELKRMIFYSIIFMMINLILNIYTWLVLIPNFWNYSIRIAAILMLIMTYVVFYKNVAQLGLIAKINNSKPVIEVQKMIGRLKLLRVKHNRFIFIFSNLFFWSLIIIVFKWDLQLLIPIIWKKAAIVPIIHITFAVIWFPLSIVILRKYDSEIGTSEFWRKMRTESFLTDESVNASLNNAHAYLKEIDAFELEK